MLKFNFFLVRQSFQTNSEVQDIHRVVPVIDGIGQAKIKIPCRTAYCKHIGVFDLVPWLQTCIQSVKCPICQEKCSIDQVYLDEYFEDIVNSVEPEGNLFSFFFFSILFFSSGVDKEVVITPDGFWNVHVVKQAAKINPVDVVIIDDD